MRYLIIAAALVLAGCQTDTKQSEDASGDAKPARVEEKVCSEAGTSCPNL